MISQIPRDLFLDILHKHFTIYELAFIARVCKLWNQLQDNPKLYNYKKTLLLAQPGMESSLPQGKFRTDCIKRLFEGLPTFEGLKLLSNRLYLGLNSIVLPYNGKLYLMTQDSLFVTSQTQMHGIVKVNNEINFFCASPKNITRRRVFRPYQLVLGEQKEEIKPEKTIQEQLQSINAFPIAVEGIKGWNKPSLTYYLLAFITPYIFVVRGLNLIAIYSVPTTNTPLRYERIAKTDVYHFEKEIWQIEQENRSTRIKVTQKTT